MFSTGDTVCACPYLMVGDPYVECGKLCKICGVTAEPQYSGMYFLASHIKMYMNVKTLCCEYEFAILIT